MSREFMRPVQESDLRKRDVTPARTRGVSFARHNNWRRPPTGVYISAVLRLAIAQLRPHKGAYEESLCRLGAYFREAGGWAEPPDLIVAPESALTGYFLEGGVRDLALPAERLFEDLSRQHRDAKAPPLDVALGFSAPLLLLVYPVALVAGTGLLLRLEELDAGSERLGLLGLAAVASAIGLAILAGLAVARRRGRRALGHVVALPAHWLVRAVAAWYAVLVLLPCRPPSHGSSTNLQPEGAPVR